MVQGLERSMERRVRHCIYQADVQSISGQRPDQLTPCVTLGEASLYQDVTSTLIKNA